MIEFDLNLDDLLRYSDPFVQNTIKTELSGMLRVFAALVLLLVLWRLFQGIKGNLEIRRREKAGYAAEKAAKPGLPGNPAEDSAAASLDNPPRSSPEIARYRPVTTKDDARIVSELARKIWSGYFGRFLDPKQVSYMLRKYQSWIAVQEQIAKGADYQLVLDENQRPVGYYAWNVADGKLHVSKLFLLPEARGRGIGGEILGQLEAEARRGGLSAMVLTVNRKNRQAIQVYESQGFQIEDEVDILIGGGYTLEDYRMVKPLAGR